MGYSIVNIKDMGDALRNTGYKNIESAVSEIIDNSVEAKAKNVFIILGEGTNGSSGRTIVNEVAFLDDGMGMNAQVLGGCLGLGSTTHAGRTGMGRFGVGLPQASLYACPVVEVYSWQNGIENCKMVSLNIEMIKTGEQTEIADPVIAKLPDNYTKYLTFNDGSKRYDFKKNGTMVFWKNCDRIQPKTRSALIPRLEFTLGQKFRYFISDESCKIKIICPNNSNMNIDLLPNDPLMLMPNNSVLGRINEPEKVYRHGKTEDLVPIFEPYTSEGNDNGEVLVKIKYYDSKNNIVEGDVKVRFSVVKTEFYDETAFINGKNPGSYPIGGHVKKLEGISIIRANREIDFRSFDFYENINEPTHRWWGCEIIFEPIMDEAFGVANNKQYVELNKTNDDEFELDGEAVLPVWNQLRSTISNTIDAMYKRNKGIRNNTRTLVDQGPTATEEIINKVEELSDDNKDSVTAGIKEILTDEERIEKGKEELVNLGAKVVDDESTNRFINNKINIVYTDKGKFSPVFDYSFTFGNVLIKINTAHDFYKYFLEKIYALDPEVKTTFELFIASFVKAVDQTSGSQGKENDRLFGEWNTRLVRYIAEQISEKK